MFCYGFFGYCSFGIVVVAFLLFVVVTVVLDVNVIV